MHIYRALLVTTFSAVSFGYSCHEPITIHTFYGSDIITEPVLIELLNCQAIQRLHHINQYGIMNFLKPQEYTRYQHSVGVLYLLRRYGASLPEQVMGLLHDVSHTVFSHVSDFLFNTVQNKYSYQDFILEWYVEHTDLKEILERYNLLWIVSLEVRDQFKMLKDELPKLCVDRLEYNLYGAYLEGLLTQEDVLRILDALEYRDNKWIFITYPEAQEFARVALYLSCNIWSAAWNCYIFSETARLLSYALERNIITHEDLIFSDDQTMWNTLTDAATCDAYVHSQIERIKNYETNFITGTAADHDYTTQGKFRWIDPFVITKSGSQLLSTLDSAFSETVREQKNRFKISHYIKYT